MGNVDEVIAKAKKMGRCKMAEASTFYLRSITPERQFYIGPPRPKSFRRGRRDGSVPRPRAGGHCREPGAALQGGRQMGAPP